MEGLEDVPGAGPGNDNAAQSEQAAGAVAAAGGSKFLDLTAN